MVSEYRFGLCHSAGFAGTVAAAGGVSVLAERFATSDIFAGFEAALVLALVLVLVPLLIMVLGVVLVLMLSFCP